VGFLVLAAFWIFGMGGFLVLRKLTQRIAREEEESIMISEFTL